jgi:hypothetical protein
MRNLRMKIGLNMTTGVMSVVGKKTLYKVTILVILGLVCFKESEFQEFTFLIFQCLAIIWKLGQRKINSGQQKQLTLPAGKCFPFLVKRKTLSYLY